MNTNQASSVLSNAIVVASLIEVWSGKVTIARDQDLDEGARGKLPPHDIYSDGQKQVIKPAILAKLESQRRMAQKDLLSIGYRSPLGYIIAPDREQELYESMQRRQAEFDAAREDLVQNLDRYYAEWETEHLGHEAFLRRKRPTPAEVASRCKFAFAVFRVAPVETAEGQLRYEQLAATTVPCLAQDIASNARQLLKTSFNNKPRVTQRAVGLVRDLVAKLKGFSMFDPRILPSAQALEHTLSGVPTKGPLSDMETMIVASLLRTLSDPDRVLTLRVSPDAATAPEDDETEDQQVLELESTPPESEEDNDDDATSAPPPPRTVPPRHVPVLL